MLRFKAYGLGLRDYRFFCERMGLADVCFREGSTLARIRSAILRDAAKGKGLPPYQPCEQLFL